MLQRETIVSGNGSQKFGNHCCVFFFSYHLSRPVHAFTVFFDLLRLSRPPSHRPPLTFIIAVFIAEVDLAGHFFRELRPFFRDQRN